MLIVLSAGVVAAPGAAATDEALAAYEAGEYGRAMAIWQPRAEAGDAEAQFRLGDVYRFGSGTEKNLDLAVEWLRRSAIQGHVRALTSLGYMYNDGEGIPDDSGKAECLYLAAGERGYAAAQWNLYLCYLERWKFGKANTWLERSLAQDYVAALENRGDVYHLNPFRRDKTEAYMYLLLAEARGSQFAAETLARVRKSTVATVQDQLRVAASKARYWRAVPETPPADLPPVDPACLAE